jgi:hypothetical protein
VGYFTSGQPQYLRQNENEINLALSEAWAWLQAQGLIVPDMENGQHGWLVLSRRARDGKRGFQKLQGSRRDHSLSFDCPITIP